MSAAAKMLHNNCISAVSKYNQSRAKMIRPETPTAFSRENTAAQ